MKIVQIFADPGQTAGHGRRWDSTTNEVEDLFWSWPADAPSSRIQERMTLDGRAMGMSFYQFEGDGRSYVQTLYSADAGATPGAITSAQPTPVDSIQLDTGAFHVSGEKMVSVLDWKTQYAIYSYTDGSPSALQADIVDFPYIIQFLSTVNYTDGSVRLISIHPIEQVMRLSTPLDGTPITTAVEMDLIIPSASVLDYSNIGKDLAYGSKEVARLLAGAGGVPTWGGAWMINYNPDNGLTIQCYGSQAELTFNADGTRQVDFVQSGNQANSIQVSSAGEILSTDVQTVSGVSTTPFNTWYIEGAPAQPAATNFWGKFVRSFEVADAA